MSTLLSDLSRPGKGVFLLRLALSFAVASIVVVAVLAVGIAVYAPEKEEDPAMPELNQVSVINLRDNPDLARMIREARNQPVDPLREAPEPMELPERQVQGFVQLEYTVNPDGTVSDVRVVGAAPAGVFDARAVERLQNSLRAPAYEDGEPVTRRASETLEFSVPASELSRPSSEPGDN
jgi:protein TonB